MEALGKVLRAAKYKLRRRSFSFSHFEFYTNTNLSAKISGESVYAPVFEKITLVSLFQQSSIS